MIVPPSFVFKMNKKKETTGFLYEEQGWVNIAHFKERETFWMSAPDNPHVSHRYLSQHENDDQNCSQSWMSSATKNSWLKLHPRGFAFRRLHLFTPKVRCLFLCRRHFCSIVANLLTRDKWLQFCKLAGSVIFSSWDKRINPCYTHAAKDIGLF